MSFKKIHVLIRLAHRHSFNEQINHSDGYNGVIKGFKYDNLHPNGAAKALAVSKKARRKAYFGSTTLSGPSMPCGSGSGWPSSSSGEHSFRQWGWVAQHLLPHGLAEHPRHPHHAGRAQRPSRHSWRATQRLFLQRCQPGMRLLCRHRSPAERPHQRRHWVAQHLPCCRHRHPAPHLLHQWLWAKPYGPMGGRCSPPLKALKGWGQKQAAVSVVTRVILSNNMLFRRLPTAVVGELSGKRAVVAWADQGFPW
ncbi:UNVERIFIED_CONTAM: hypothetical protein K2H54_039418 [Gekko kuhli]